GDDSLSAITFDSDFETSLHVQKSDVDLMRTKLRRLEEENSRKDRQIEQLLDPSRGSDFVRTLTEKRPDSGWVVNGLKQRILKLEQQCKEKDNTINKLQTDMKTTNLEEMRIAMETYYEEIHRLQTLLASSETTGKKPSMEKKMGVKRQKKMSSALLNLSRSVQELTEENQSLKEDLDRMLSNSPTISKIKGYMDWSKPRLLRRIAELEKKVSSMESSKPHASDVVKSNPLVHSTSNSTVHKQPHSDHQEDNERLRGAVRNLKEERSALQNQLQEKDLEMKQLLQTKADLEKELENVKKSEKERREQEIALKEEIKTLTRKFQELEEIKKEEKDDPMEITDETQEELLPSPPSSRHSLQDSEPDSSDEDFSRPPSPCPDGRRDAAARILQAWWKVYKHKSSPMPSVPSPVAQAEGSPGLEEAITIVQSIFRAHLARTRHRPVLPFASVLQGREVTCWWGWHLCSMPYPVQALLLLGGAALACLALDLLFLLFYSFWLCCRRRKSEEHLDADCCCTAWCVIIATLVCSAGIAVGFYGNGETSDGIHRVTYSLRHANRTVAGVQDRRLQGLLETLLSYTAAIPFWRNPAVSLEVLAEQVDLYDWYRWLGYLGLLLLDVIICLLVLVGLIRSSKGILVGVCLLGVLALVISWGALGLELAASVGSSDFCVDPDTYVTKMVEEHSVLSGDILQYYLACSPHAANPFQQKLSGSHKALVEMHDVVTELLRSVPREQPTTKDPLLRVQEVLNGTEVNLQHLTALVDCRSLHLDYVQALTGFCYDGVEGLIYLALFSFVTALMFSSIVCSVPHTWQQKRGPDEDGEEETAPGPRQAHDSLYRVHMPSLYSCGSSYGSETSIPAAAHTVSNAPVTEYMSQNANFQNPRCENTPLIGRESPPPSFEAFCAGGLAPGWSLLVQGQSDSGEDKFEINFLSEGGDIAFHIKPRFSSATMVGNAFQDGRWGQEEVSSVFPLTLGEPFELMQVGCRARPGSMAGAEGHWLPSAQLEVSSDAEHFHVYAQEHKVLQFPHRQRPLAAITRVRVLSDHRLAQVELAKRGLSWG
ncbi:Protein tweety like protein 3, partial [Tupaia chinensis]